MYDSTSQKTILWGAAVNISNIYSTDWLYYNSTTHGWTLGPGNRSQVDICTVDGSLPGDRHPYQQLAIDPAHGILLTVNGVNQGCKNAAITTNGTTTVTAGSGTTFPTNGNYTGISAIIGGITYTISSVTDSTHLLMATTVPAGSTTINFPGAGDTSPRIDTYLGTLNVTPASLTFTKLSPALNPAQGVTNGPFQESAMDYDPDHDAFILYGNDNGPDTHDTFAYCSTHGGGTLTAAQTSIGCTSPDNWTELTVSGRTAGVTPSQKMGWLWSPEIHKFVLFGGRTSGHTITNQTWTYDPVTKVFANAAPASSPTIETLDLNFVAFTYVSSKHKFFYHRPSGPDDWWYDPVLNTWVQDTTTGTGSTSSTGTTLAFDPTTNTIIGWDLGTAAKIWELPVPNGNSFYAGSNIKGVRK
jgi:hypothetical protein